MTTVLNPAAQLFLVGIARTEQQLTQASEEVSSGKKVNVASDAPDQIDDLLQLRADEQHNQQIESNLTLAQSNAQAADSTLGSAIQLMDQAVQVGAEGANSTDTSTSLQSLSQQVGSILDEMVSYSQTTVQGQYIFSGDQPDSPTFQADSSSATGVDQLAAPTATQQIENPAGGSFAAGLSAQEIFYAQNPDGTPSTSNVFADLNALQTALASGDAQTVATAVNNVKTASAYLNQMEAFYGDTEQNIQDAQTFASQNDTQLQTQISNIQDADIPAAATQLTQAQTQLQASFEMEAQMPHKTLFDYLG